MAKVYLLGKTIPMDGSKNMEKLAILAGNLYGKGEKPNVYSAISNREIGATIDEFYKESKEDLYYNASLFVTFVFGIDEVNDETIDSLVENISPIYDGKMSMTGNNHYVILSGNALEFIEFFKEACCSKYGVELNDIADQMLEICLSEAPNLFKDAGAPCTFGKCDKENSCGKKRQAKVKQIIKTY